MSIAALDLSENAVGVVAILSVFVLSPIAIAYARVVWKRAMNPPERSLSRADTGHQLAQIQQSIDAMAVEIERISEGQRFVTKLLNERPRDRLSS